MSADCRPHIHSAILGATFGQQVESPAGFVFLDRNYCYKSVVTQISQEAPIPSTGRKFLSNQGSSQHSIPLYEFREQYALNSRKMCIYTHKHTHNTTQLDEPCMKKTTDLILASFYFCQYMFVYFMLQHNNSLVSYSTNYVKS